MKERFTQEPIFGNQKNKEGRERGLHLPKKY
jgi:hypothetical protein